VNNIRIDISFNSMPKLVEKIETELQQKQRKPELCDATILFDKLARLHQLKDRIVREARPTNWDSPDVNSIQFEMYYSYTKPQKYLYTAPATANLIMHMELREVLKLHYKLHGRWWVSDKHLLADLSEWDPTFQRLLTEFLSIESVIQKYSCWTAMIEYVLEPVGGKAFHQMESDCECKHCQSDLQRLIALFAG
jgi:hypothetical protein